MSSPLDPASHADLDLVRAVLMPALRWDGSRYRPEGTEDDPAALAASGVAGFIVFGGTAGAVAELTDGLRRVATRPLLFGADLERGAGQQFDGATQLPPAGALGSIDDPDVTSSAGELTAREARTLGIDIVFAPVADVASVPDNPIVGPRGFAGRPEAAARHVAAWVEGALRGGALPCVKHFPGHGRTTGDSHVGEVAVTADVAMVRSELAPFRAAVAAGVPLVMPGHLAVAALDPTGRIATTSEAMLRGILRRELGFGGVIVSDAMLMAGAGDLATTAVEALEAGMDLLIYPASMDVAERAIAEAAEGDPAVQTRLRAAAERIERLARGAAARRDGPGSARTGPAAAAGSAPGSEPGSESALVAGSAPDSTSASAAVGRPEDRSRAAGWALSAIDRVRGDSAPPGPDPAPRIVEVDDDSGGPYPTPSREPFRRAMGVGPRKSDAAGEHGEAAAHPSPTTVVALWADTRGWKGRAGLSAQGATELARILDASQGPTHVVVFGGPRVVADVPEGPTVWLAWGGEALMQRAAAERLLGGGTAREPTARSAGGSTG